MSKKMEKVDMIEMLNKSAESMQKQIVELNAKREMTLSIIQFMKDNEVQSYVPARVEPTKEEPKE